MPPNIATANDRCHTDNEPFTCHPSMPKIEDPEVAIVRDTLLSKPNFLTVIGLALRKSFDEVIDGARTGRYMIEELEKTEKTYIGTKVEIVLRDELELERGQILDNLISGIEVDTKFSLSGGWMIPREAVDKICLLVTGNDNSGKYSVGIIRASLGNLTKKGNQDGKRSVSADGKKSIVWLVQNEPMPRNFLLDLDPEVRIAILSKNSGMKRINALFKHVTGKIIPRHAIEQVARQKDPMRRARQMKPKLIDEGYLVLCATYKTDRVKMRDSGFDNFDNDAWLSIKL